MAQGHLDDEFQELVGTLQNCLSAQGYILLIPIALQRLWGQLAPAQERVTLFTGKGRSWAVGRQSKSSCPSLRGAWGPSKMLMKTFPAPLPP